ncbi:MAG: TetR/AcrR family transcriptional regulator [Ignavibacteriota bacterium]
MKQPRRLTRQESQQATRARLIEAAERFFIRYGFEGSAVERITEAAGFSRGAFYSNFRDKDELFIAVLNRRRLAISDALGEVFRREPDAAKRLQAVRDWYVNQGQQKQWIVLESEFTLRAARNRTVRARLAALRRQELETYSALVAQHFSEIGLPPIERPETLALSLMAIVEGLGTLSLIETDRDAKSGFTEARNLVFNRLIAPKEVDGAVDRGIE